MIEERPPENVTPERGDIPGRQEVFDDGIHLGFLWENVELLPPHIQEALQYAIEARRESQNRKLKVGASVVDEEGNAISVCNSPGGAEGHAEKRVWKSWWTSKERSAKTKPVLLALAGIDNAEEPIVSIDMMTKDKQKISIHAVTLCGGCREYLREHLDYDASGSYDIPIFSITNDGRVFETTLRTSYLGPHKPTNVKVPLHPNMITEPTGLERIDTREVEHLLEREPEVVEYPHHWHKIVLPSKK